MDGKPLVFHKCRERECLESSPHFSSAGLGVHKSSEDLSGRATLFPRNMEVHTEVPRKESSLPRSSCRLPRFLEVGLTICSLDVDLRSCVLLRSQLRL